MKYKSFEDWFEKEIHTPMKTHANYGSAYVDDHLAYIKTLTEAAFNAGRYVYTNKQEEDK